jgi:hypothetical protein
MSMNRASIESYINSALTQPVKPWVDTSVLNQYHSSLVRTGELLQAMGLEEKKIVGDASMTDVGKLPKFKALAEQSVPKFAPLGRVIGEADATMARLTALMTDPITARPKDMDTSEAYSREREIRREIGRGAANVEFLKALEGDHLETARALLNAPGRAWVSDDIRLRGEEGFAERTSPKEYEKRRSVEFLRDHLRALADMVRQWLVGLGADKDLVAKTLNLE